MTTDKFGQPYGSSWAGMSMGEGRKLKGGPGMGTVFQGCPKSPDGYHDFTAISNVQSVEHFVCDYCGEDFYD